MMWFIHNAIDIGDAFLSIYLEKVTMPYPVHTESCIYEWEELLKSTVLTTAMMYKGMYIL